MSSQGTRFLTFYWSNFQIPSRNLPRSTLSISDTGARCCRCRSEGIKGIHQEWVVRKVENRDGEGVNVKKKGQN